MRIYPYNYIVKSEVSITTSRNFPHVRKRLDSWISIINNIKSKYYNVTDPFSYSYYATLWCSVYQFHALSALLLLDLPLKEKICRIAKEIYRAGEITFSEKALAKLAEYENNGYAKLPVCIAKTQNSISDDPKLKGAPHGFNFTVNDVHLSAGAGFVVALAGNILTMPGLPKHPAAEQIDVDEDGKISGLF